MKTIDYYNQHADKFVASTFHVKMEELYQPFIRYLLDSGSILDLGCGSGRDSLAFKNLAGKVVEQTELRNKNLAPTQKVEITNS